jgi:hypothetical protein
MENLVSDGFVKEEANINGPYGVRRCRTIKVAA